jgi:hypothetical protein
MATNPPTSIDEESVLSQYFFSFLSILNKLDSVSLGTFQQYKYTYVNRHCQVTLLNFF